MPHSDEINVLTGLKTAKVALVNRGANKKPRFPITKSETTVNKEILEAVLGVEAENESKIGAVFKDLSAKGQEAVTGALRLLSAFADELPADVLKGIGELSGFDVPAVKAEMTPEEIEEMKKKLAKEKARKAKEEEDGKGGFPFMKSLSGLSDELRSQLEPVFKAQHEAHLVEIQKAQEQVNAAKAEAVAIAKALEVERSERATKEWIAKAESELSHFPGKSSDELGRMLKSLEDHDPKLAQAQYESMRAASDAIRKSDMLKTSGVGGGVVAGSAADKISKMAEQMIAKSSERMSQAEAETEVLKQHPELYTEYLLENPAQIGQK